MKSNTKNSAIFLKGLIVVNTGFNVKLKMPLRL